MLFGPTVHTLRVGLLDVEAEVWRRIVVDSDTTLPEVARLLGTAMGWQGYHLYQFDVGEILFGPPDDDADDVIDERLVTLKQVLPRVGSTLRWDYDFGDGWEHAVVVEAIDAPDPEAPPPACLAGESACPPEDCGGAGGFSRMLAALADVDDPEHEEYATWAPDGYDASRFDAGAATRAMRAG